MICNQELILRIISYWKARDVQSTLGLFHENVVYRLHADPETTVYAGETRGKEAVRGLLLHMLAEWDYLEYAPRLLGLDNDVARVQTTFRLRHKESGEVLTGSKRFVIRIRDGLIAEVDEFQDAALVAAFMRLATRYLTRKLH